MPERARYGVSFVSSKGNILCRLVNIQLYKIFAIINRAIKGLHCTGLAGFPTSHRSLFPGKVLSFKLVLQSLRQPPPSICEAVYQSTHYFPPEAGPIRCRSNPVIGHQLVTKVTNQNFTKSKCWAWSAIDCKLELSDYHPVWWPGRLTSTVSGLEIIFQLKIMFPKCRNPVKSS